jgi:quercetin dioxygenase-like cupin family protein
MHDEVKQIATRIRDAREISGLAPDTLAADLGVPLPTYLTYESGAADIPVGVLYQLAGRLNVALTALLSGEDPRLHVYAVVRGGHGVRIDRRQAYIHESLAANFVGKRMEPFVVTVPPDAAETPITCNAHPGQEFNYVLEGTLRVAIAGHELVLEAGDAVYFDAAQPHGMLAVGDAPAKFLAIIA